jgi:hypothetical protein
MQAGVPSIVHSSNEFGQILSLQETNMNSLKIPACLLMIAIVFGACGGDSAPVASKSEPVAPEQRSVGNMANVSRPSNTTSVATDSRSTQKKVSTADPKSQVSLDKSAASETEPVNRKIVRNADLQLESGEPEIVQQKITAIAESKNGFVVESQQSSSDVRATRRDTVTMTVRVPADKFAETIDEIRKSAERVIGETVKSDDVTEEFIDVEARLKAKKALEAQFMEIMKRANSVEDALNVQSELADVRSDIEQIEGRLRFLQNQTSLSTIKLRIQTPAAIANSSRGFFYELWDSISRGLDGAFAFVFGFVTFAIAVLPFLILVVLPIVLVIRYLWRRVWRNEAAAKILADEIDKQ